MKKLLALAAALVIAALSGCGLSRTPVSGTAPEPSASAAPETPPRAEVRFEVLTRGVKYGEADLYYYSFPQLDVDIEGSSAGQALTEELNGLLTPSEDALAPVTEAAGAAYEALDEAGRSGWSRQGYGFDRSVELMRCGGRVLSVCVTDSRSLGAPHPNNSGFGITFDLKTGGRLAASAIAEDYPALTGKVRGYILASAAENPNAGAFYGLEDFAAGALESGEWYLSEDGLVIFAPPEEIAPYAVGSVSFVIPYAALEGLIKPEFLPEGGPQGGEGALSISQSAEGATLRANLGGASSFALKAKEPVTGLLLSELVSDGEGGWVESRPLYYVSRLEAGESLGVTVPWSGFIAYGIEYGGGEGCIISMDKDGGAGFMLEEA